MGRATILTAFAKSAGISIKDILPGKVPQTGGTKAFGFLIFHVERDQPTFGAMINKNVIGTGRQDMT